MFLPFQPTFWFIISLITLPRYYLLAALFKKNKAVKAKITIPNYTVGGYGIEVRKDI